MKWEIFKRNLQSEMSNHLSDVDPNEIWSGIEADVDAINASDRRKSGLLYLLLIGLVAGGTAYFIHSNKFNPSTQLNDLPIIETNPLIVNHSNSLHHTNLENNNATIQETATLKESTVYQIRQIETPPANIQISNINVAKRITPSKEQSSFRKNSVPENTHFTSSKGKLNNNEFAETTATAQSMAFDNSINATTFNKQEENLYAIVPNSDKHFHPTKAKAYTLLPVNAVSRQSNFALPPSGVNKMKAQNDFHIEDYWTKRKGFQLSVGIITGVSKPIKILTEKENDAETLAFRTKSETPIVENYFGAQLVAKHSSGFEIITGISKHSILEKFQYQFTYEVIHVVDETIEVDGDMVTLQQMNTTYRSFINKKYFNRQNYIQVPIMVGYQFNKGRWGLGLRSGMYANYLYSTKGKLANQEGEDILLDSEVDYRFESKFGIGVLLALSMDVDLSKHFTFNVSPNFRYHLTDQTPSGTLSQKYMFIGGQVGLSYNFRR